MGSVSIGAVGIIDAIATPSSIFSGSGPRSVSGGGVGPDGGQGGSGYDVDASLTACGASDERALPGSIWLGLMDGIGNGMGMNRLLRGARCLMSRRKVGSTSGSRCELRVGSLGAASGHRCPGKGDAAESELTGPSILEKMVF